MKELNIPRINETIYQETLPNGLTVFYYPKEDFEKTFAIFSTNYGSIDQKFTPLNSDEFTQVPDGIAHFLEHKMFEKEDGDVFQHFSERGASANAFTSFTQTAYLFSSTEDEERNVETLLDFVQDPYFTEQTVEKEKGIIEQEIRMYDDQSDWRLFFGTLQSMFENHPVRIDIAGTVDSIYTITHEDLYLCYETFYHPSNMSLFVIGNFSLQEMAELVRNNQAKKEFAPIDDIKRDYGEEKDPVFKKKEVIHMPVQTPKCMVGIKDKKEHLQTSELLKNELVRELVMDLYFSKSGKYFEELYNEGLVIETLRLESYMEKSFGVTMIGGRTLKPEEFSDRVIDMLLNLKNSTISEEEFARMKKRKYGELIRDFNELEGTANQIIHYHDLSVDYRNIFETLENLTRDDMKQVIDGWIDQDQITVCMVLPEEE
ncbi:EF-P 5-aminopentanol modification-associated protein YfmH [Allobacillus sp. GCM10007491]|uniref:Insulinase family protein n=1 Tax=Allobacillus saliphilus TaxID=2912308 RepID=A0A941CUH4_9BACI|nr:pitrilysin family protein [Allobacillus saliphilus]MBR7552950.1 insulinase family protein [Allobacillus saliphilus]